AGRHAAARQVDGAVAGALGQQRVVGVDGADDLQGAFFGQRLAKEGAGRGGTGHGRVSVEGTDARSGARARLMERKTRRTGGRPGQIDVAENAAYRAGPGAAQ